MRIIDRALKVLLALVYAIGAAVFVCAIVFGGWLIWNIASLGGIYVAAGVALALFLAWLVFTAAHALTDYVQWGSSEL